MWSSTLGDSQSKNSLTMSNISYEDKHNIFITSNIFIPITCSLLSDKYLSSLQYKTIFYHQIILILDSILLYVIRKYKKFEIGPLNIWENVIRYVLSLGNQSSASTFFISLKQAIKYLKLYIYFCTKLCNKFLNAS